MALRFDDNLEGGSPSESELSHAAARFLDSLDLVRGFSMPHSSS